MRGRGARVGIVAAALVLAAAGAFHARAGDPPQAPGQPVEIVRLTVRPGHEAAMELFLERLAHAARRTGAPIRWRVFRRVDGGAPLYVLVLRAGSAEPLDTFGGLTASETLIRAYGDQEAQRLLGFREEALESMQRERFAAMPALDLGD